MKITVTDNVDEVMSDISNWFDSEFSSNLVKKVESAAKSALKKVDKEIAAFQKIEIEKAYKEAIKKFYEGYEPWLYKRTYSLYDLLVIENAGGESNEVSWGYDSDKMVSTRHDQPGGREYLYDIVFVKGWHGGADKISQKFAPKYGYHPNPGTPHYRVPDWFFTNWAWYPAARHESSPKEMVEKAIEEMDKPGGIFWTEYERLANQYINEAVMNLAL